MKEYGVVLLNVRVQNALTIKAAAKKIGKSTGWLSSVENGKEGFSISKQEFERILELYGEKFDAKKFGSWVGVAAKKEKEPNSVEVDGAILKYLRTKKKMTLVEASILVGLSKGYLSKLENGRKTISKKLRDELLGLYGYKPSSYKNFSSGDKRSNLVPARYKLAIVVNQLPEDKIEKLLRIAESFCGKGAD